jgi:uncharacterized membrane protein HdeD (DUF308 family)
MEVSFFLARVLGVYLIIMALAVMVNKERYKAAYKELKRDTMEVHLMGMIILIFGLLIVSVHNIWTSWPILITVIGWGMLLKGMLALIAPNLLLKFGKDMGIPETINLYGFAGIIIGAFLTYVGFFI